MVDAICADDPDLEPARVMEEIRNRENLISTRIATSIAIPHAQLPDVDHVIIAAGRSVRGIQYDKLSDEKVHLIVMILGRDTTHLEVLSDVVARLAERQLYARILAAESTEGIYAILIGSAGGPQDKADRNRLGRSRTLFTHMQRIAEEIAADVLFVHLNTSKLPEFVMEEMTGRRWVLITHGNKSVDGSSEHGPPVVNIPFRGLSRSSMVEMSLLFALANGHFSGVDRAVSILGENDEWDTILVTDGSSELERFFEADLIQDAGTLEHRVLAKTLHIAGSLGAEGREGKPVGTIFVLGDCENVQHYCQQMVVNPFKGYAEEERNILDPSLEETIKEFAKIDGAFIVRGDGVIISGGTFIRSSNISVDLPKGLGSRHMAGASISAATQALAIVISESTRKISVFRNGRRLTLT